MVMVIAEAGVNHNGDVSLAHELLQIAYASGADAIKYQMFDPEKLEPPGERRTMLHHLRLPNRAWPELKKHADDLSLEFIVTPFDVDSLQRVVDLGVNYIKIGSANITDMALIFGVGHSGMRAIISTGMATPEEIDRAAVWIKRTMIGPRPTLLHCTSAYPTPVEDVNLRAMMCLGKLSSYFAFGLSDHTLSTVIPAAAVAMGAEVIEKHLTLDTTMEGPDHKASLPPDNFAEMVANIREVEAALGDGIKRPMPSEAAVMEVRQERENWRISAQ